MKRIAAALFTVALVAGACTTDEDDDAAGTETAPPTEEPVEDGAGDGDVGNLAPGVSEDSIAIGIINVDLESISNLVQLDHGDYRAVYDALIADINAGGGVGGRQIVATHADFNPIDSASQDASCIELTQDVEVFAVIGGFFGDQVLCYVDTNATPAVGGDMNPERLARAEAPWFAGNPSQNRRLDLILGAFVDRGDFEGRTTAVIAAAADQRVMEEEALPFLTEAGIEPVEVAVITTPPSDDVASDAEIASYAARFEASGADQVLVVGAGVAQFLGGLENTRYRPQILSTELGATQAYIFDAQGRDLTVLDGAVIGNQAEQPIWWEDDAVQDCIDIVEAAIPGLEIIDPAERQPDEPENLVSVYNACMILDLFTQITEAAGEDLTVETWAAAGEALGQTSLPGLGPASFGPDKHDGADAVYVYTFDADTEEISSDGVPITPA